MFKHIITRTPCEKIVDGITGSPELGTPNYANAVEQHKTYIQTLNSLGLPVLVLPSLEDFPDSCFVEDVALVLKDCAIITNPGADTRNAEINYIKDALSLFYKEDKIFNITGQATLDGGDVMMVGNILYVGLSARTNEAGIKSLSDIVSQFGVKVIKIALEEVLHLKTGVVYLENNTLLCYGEFMSTPEFKDYKKIEIPADESYAANCIWVNDVVIVPKGYPKVLKSIQDAGYKTITCDTSEFKKIDGGLSCLSLRLPV
ncbi:MAG: arginine deiminase family protein [Clostridia bacterium]